MATFTQFLYFSLLLLLQEQVLTNNVNYTLRLPHPQLGSLVTLKGELEFVPGVYLVTINMKVKSYI